MCEGGDCCRSFSKIILIIVNLFFFLLGLLMLAFGIAMVVAPDKVAQSVFSGVDLSILGGNNWIIKAAGIFMIVLGAVVAIIGSFGFFGACCENRVLLVLYLVIVIIILLAEVALIIFAAVFPAAFMDLVKDGVNGSFIDNYSQDLNSYANQSVFIGGGKDGFAYSWVVTQIGAKCCGLNGPSDYTNGRYDPQEKMTMVNGVNNTPVAYPLSCCKLKEGKKFPLASADDFLNLPRCMAGDSGFYNNVGCYDAIEGTIKQAAKIAIGIAAAIVGLEIIIIIFGFILCCSIHRSKSLTV